jgi:uncharacterized protein YoxC
VITHDQLLYAALAVAALSLVVALVAVIQVNRARKQLKVLRGTTEETDLLTATAGQAQRVDELFEKVQRLSTSVALCQRDVAASLRHLAVVRFNAMSDMGGQFSFSAAILDDQANGIILTSIQGHNQGRIYAKTILNGECEQPLSPEEKQAIASARPVGAA